MKKAVVCIVATQPQAEALVTDLEAMGFPRTDISVLFPNRQDTRGFALENNTKAPEGAVVGVGAGGVVGGTFGLLAGIGALAIPGLGPFIAAGPLMAALSGAAAGAAVGGVTGALVGMGIPEYEAKTYEGRLKAGGILVAVHTDNADERKRAETIFRRRGAHDIATAAEVARY